MGLSIESRYKRDDYLDVIKNRTNWIDGKFIPGRLVGSYFHTAKIRNIEFNVSVYDLEDQWNLQEGNCAYTGIELTLPRNRTDRSFNASLDRIDSSEPYIKSNIQWVLKEVNRMKMDLREDRFLELCKRISARF